MTATDQNYADTKIIRYGVENKPTQTMRVPARRRRRTGLPTRSGTAFLIGLVLVLLAAVLFAGAAL